MTSTTQSPAADSPAPSATTGTMQLEITKIERCADGVAAITFARPDGELLPPWEPGAHLELTLPSGRVRQYSLCSNPADHTHYTIGVLLVPESDGGRGGSIELHSLSVGDTVTSSAPHNHFRFDGSHRKYVFIAGGIGVTPIIAMARAAEASGADWEIHYSGRRRATMGFIGDLEQLNQQRVRLYPKDETGTRIDVNALLGAPTEGTQVYACGPGSMLTAILESGGAWPDGAVRIEQFESLGTTDVEALKAGDEFEVEVSATGQVVAVPEGISILEALRDAGLDVASSCEEGFCGLCETDVVSGDIDHRDEFLTEDERQSGTRMMLCVSRCQSPCSRLVLDVQ